MERTDAAAGFEVESGPTLDDVIWRLLDARGRAERLSECETLAELAALLARLIDGVYDAIELAKEVRP